MKINKDKRIGNVVFIVEGRKTEPRIIKNIFNKIFGFKVYQTNREGDIVRLKKEKDVYSKIAIIVNKKPQITIDMTTNDYILNIFKLLKDNGLDPFESAIYYIFDRDENDSNVVVSLMDKLSNARDNDDFEMNGLLLLSYPCVEAFYMNCYLDDKVIENRSELKKYVKASKYGFLQANNLLDGCKKFLDILKNTFNLELVQDDLDSFSEINKHIFSLENDHYNQSEYYYILSLIFVALLDLGLIEFY